MTQNKLCSLARCMVLVLFKYCTLVEYLKKDIWSPRWKGRNQA